ncbi:MAG: 50S ribosomal protein L29 [Candidatus Pacebacteria bacterium]|nr:50S ribosomal protein L29 [Candidatus Paceibacterota bacterium]
MEKENYKNKQEKELKTILAETRDSLRIFRFKVAKGKAKNVKEGRTLKRTVARLLTEINLRNKKQ